jgi:hypothetical protein
VHSFRFVRVFDTSTSEDPADDRRPPGWAAIDALKVLVPRRVEAAVQARDVRVESLKSEILRLERTHLVRFLRGEITSGQTGQTNGPFPIQLR